MQHAKGDEASHGTDIKSKATARPTLRDKIFLDSIHFKGHTLRTGKAHTLRMNKDLNRLLMPNRTSRRLDPPAQPGRAG